MADSYVQVAPDDSGKKVQTYENTVGGQTVEAQAVVLVDSTGAPITLPTIASTTNLLAGDGSGNAVASEISVVASAGGRNWVFRNDNNSSSGSNITISNEDAAATNAGISLDLGTAGAYYGDIFLDTGAFGLNFYCGTGGAYTYVQGPILFSTNQGSIEQFRINGTSVASGANASLDELKVNATTSTVTGTTQITTAKGFNKFSIYKPTYTDSSAVTIDRGATLYIEDAPAAAGSVTLTNPYALWVDNGTTRLDGGLTVGGTADPGTGIINASNGYTVAGAAASGKILKGDGSKFVASTETYAAPGTSGNVMTSDGTNWTSAPSTATPGAAAQTTIAGPKTTTSGTAVMAGLAGAITPAAGGSILVAVSGQAAGSSSTALVTAQIRYGTGTAPTLGAATTGTALGIACQLNTGTALQNWFLTGAATGLSAATAYWVDVQFLTAARTGSISNVCVAVVEG